MINTHRRRKNNYPLLLIFLILIEFVNSFLRGSGVVEMSISILLRKGIFVYFGFNLIYIILSIRKISLKYNLVTKSIITGIYFITYSVLMYFIKINNYDLTEMFNLVMWFIVLIVFYHYGFPEDIGRMEILILIFTLLIAFLYTKYVILSNVFIWNNAELVNSIYYLVAILPITVFFRNKVIALLIQFLIAILVINSFKTTAIIICGISFGIILIFNQNNSNRSLLNKITKFILYSFITSFLFILVLYSVNRYMNINVLQIITENFNDGGNGRTYLWSSAIDTIKKGTYFQVFTGFGFDYMGKTTGISTHNDYLEVLLNFGIIGFILFIRFLYRIGIEFFRIKNVEIVMSKRLIVVQILLMFMFSNTIYVSKYFLFLTALCGMLMNYDSKVLKGKI